jgi:diadenosine tetraphosphatase ApaH/serine/threonine PP2A family protein phosphatase
MGDLTICNSGSVGAPYDGDPRASYLLIDNNEPTIRRVEYDVEAEVCPLRASNYPYKHRLAEMRRRGLYVPPVRERKG